VRNVNVAERLCHGKYIPCKGNLANGPRDLTAGSLKPSQTRARARQTVRSREDCKQQRRLLALIHQISHPLQISRPPSLPPHAHSPFSDLTTAPLALPAAGGAREIRGDGGRRGRVRHAGPRGHAQGVRSQPRQVRRAPAIHPVIPRCVSSSSLPLLARAL
jgi:hypothetical protein